jgi:DNA modification methylase
MPRPSDVSAQGVASFLSDIDRIGAAWGIPNAADVVREVVRRAAGPVSASPGEAEPVRRSLVERFGLPPFSIFDARQGYWQTRKAAWLALGVKGEVSREDAQAFTSGSPRQLYGTGPAAADTPAEAAGGTSVFDPVLCELAVRWFSPVGGLVLDPFAGGAVRGVVAAATGRRYVGVDLRADQVKANQDQWAELSPKLTAADAALAPNVPAPRWVCGDSLSPGVFGDECADLIFSCPPYADLERYSDDPRDLSTMSYSDFVAAYRKIIAACVARLRPDRFAVWVVGDVRDGRGVYRNFPAHTIAAFQAVGAELYSEAVLITAVGSLPLRAGSAFAAARKLGKSHQNVLVFVKGDGKRATVACGSADFGDAPKLIEA